MKKYLLIILSIVTIHTAAMKIQKYSKNKENEQDFIHRTKALKTKSVPEKYIAHLPYSSSHPKQSYLLSAYSTNNKLIALLQKMSNLVIGSEGLCTSEPTLIIIDTRNNQKILEMELEEKSHITFNKIALSRDGKTIATLHQEVDNSIKDEEPLRKNIVTITNLATKQTESHEVPYYFMLSQGHPTIAFNKQGTDIILHGKKCNFMMTDDESWICSPLHPSDPNCATYPYQHHEIIHITMDTSHPEPS